MHQLNRDIRLILTDMDGTLLTSDLRVSDASRDAIRTARAAGVATAFATGRVDRLVDSYVKQMEISLPVISCNGALIRDLRTEEILYLNALEPDTATALLEWGLRHRLDLLVYTPARVWYPEHSRRIRFFLDYNHMADTLGHARVPLTVYGLRDLDRVAAEGVVKLFLAPPFPEPADAVRDFLTGRYRVDVVESVPGTLDVIAPGSSKGDGLVRLAAHMGIDPRQVAAFGDGDNDVSMLEAAGLSVAMGNARPSAAEAADVVTDTNDNDGFARAVNRYVLRNTREEAVV